MKPGYLDKQVRRKIDALALLTSSYYNDSNNNLSLTPSQREQSAQHHLCGRTWVRFGVSFLTGDRRFGILVLHSRLLPVRLRWLATAVRVAGVVVVHGLLLLVHTLLLPKLGPPVLKPYLRKGSAVLVFHGTKRYDVPTKHQGASIFITMRFL